MLLSGSPVRFNAPWHLESIIVGPVTRDNSADPCPFLPAESNVVLGVYQDMLK